ncbi:argininosuccinate lyase [Metarhizium album ARSEF 1941]|uniref:Argininosuccinate lyase n=1 Tax=Metarhizium album (strain ARSEF 1941) TaxID=1081103 RepID=A0A0B2WL28_METAS|nr:argininosuccinate lyase [Metarhizium album ARSEF 1941]KHN96736.1 argininosuccinate lyase [Metarhizium album ARSEF 1941]
MVQLNESPSFDEVPCHADIPGSITFARGRQRLNIITDDELKQITARLNKVGAERTTALSS